MSELLDTEIKFLPGVGPKRAELLAAEANIHTFRDLVYYFPYKYVDKTRFYTVRELDTDMQYVQIKGKIRRYSTEGGGSAKRLTADFYDDTGMVRLVWFKGQKWVLNTYKVEKEYIIYGKPTLFSGAFNIVHPEIEETEKKAARVEFSPRGAVQYHREDEGSLPSFESHSKDDGCSVFAACASLC